MSYETFTNRYVEHQTVKRLDKSAVTGSGGWTASAPAEVLALLYVGKPYGLETYGGSLGTICGWYIDGQWHARKSDQRIEQDRADWLAKYEQDKRDRLAESRRDWIGREENLPGWLKERIHVFHERGGEKFELDGWGYELVVCELTALYVESDGVDSEAVNAYAEKHGTSGNQHDCAKALARAHVAGLDLSGTVSALSPLTGDAYYGNAS